MRRCRGAAAAAAARAHEYARHGARARDKRSWSEWWRGAAAPRAPPRRHPTESEPVPAERAPWLEYPQSFTQAGPQSGRAQPGGGAPALPPPSAAAHAHAGGALQRSPRRGRSKGGAGNGDMMSSLSGAVAGARSQERVAQLLERARIARSHQMTLLMNHLGWSVPAMRKLLLWGLTQQDRFKVEAEHFERLLSAHEAAGDERALQEVLKTAAYMQSHDIELSEAAYSTLARMYARHSRLAEAEETLRRMRTAGYVGSPLVHECMLQGYARKGDLTRLLVLVGEMRRDGVELTVVGLNALVRVLAAQEATLGQAQEVVRCMRSRVCPIGAEALDITAGAEARAALESLPPAAYGADGVARPDADTFAALVDGYGTARRPEGAVRALDALLEEGLDISHDVADGMVRAHVLADEDDKARLFMTNLRGTTLAPPRWPSASTYNAILRAASSRASAYRLVDTVRWFDRMATDGVAPDTTTATLVLGACIKAQKFSYGLKVYQYMLDMGAEDLKEEAAVAGLLYKLRKGAERQAGGWWTGPEESNNK